MKAKIWQVLPYGHRRAMSVDVIKNLIQEDIDTTIIRQLIRDLIFKDEKLIASNNNGFFKIRNRSELNQYVGSLYSRAKNILKRADKLLELWDKQFEKA